MASLTQRERRFGGSSKLEGAGLPACTCVCMHIAVTAATCHLFHFKAPGVTQVLWRRGQGRRWAPRGAGSLLAREEEQVAAGRRGDVPSSLSRVGSECGTRVAQNRRVLQVVWEE